MSYDLKYVNPIERPDFEKIAKKKYFSDKTLQVDIYEDGVIIPFQRIDGKAYAGVISREGQYSELSRDADIDGVDFSSFTKGNLSAVKKEDTVLYLGLYKEQWGHFITTVVGRLWYLVKKRIPGIKIAYVSGDGFFSAHEIKGNYLEFFDILGIAREDLIEIKKPVCFQKVIIPETSHVPEKYYTKEFRELFDYLKESVVLNRPVYDDVYFTRCGHVLSDEKDFGERELVRVFTENGFHVVEPAGKTLREQIWLAKHAKRLVCVSGTLTHNILFAEQGIELIILNRQGYPMMSHAFQGTINDMRGACITNIDASWRLLPVNGAGPNVFYVSNYLMEYLKDKNFKIPKRKESHILRKFLVLGWYFLKWLDLYNKDDPMHLDRLQGQMDIRAIRIYEFFRTELKWFDSDRGRKLRKKYYRIVNKYGRL